MPRASYQESSLSIKSIIVCLSNHSPTHGVQREAMLSDSDEKYIFTIQDATKYPETTVTINVEWVKVIVDSGASVNVLNQETVDRTKAPNSNFHLIPKLIHAYGTKQLFSWHWWPIYGNHFYSQQQINRSHFLCFAPNLDVLSVLCPQQPLIFCKSISRTSLCNKKTFKFIQSSTNTANCFCGTGILKKIQVKLQSNEAAGPVAHPLKNPSRHESKSQCKTWGKAQWRHHCKGCIDWSIMLPSLPSPHWTIAHTISLALYRVLPQPVYTSRSHSGSDKKNPRHCQHIR